ERDAANPAFSGPACSGSRAPRAQGNATLFVSQFFGLGGLMSFIAAVPENNRPALLQSLLFEACGRTVNPVNGAVGLLPTGNWHVCQAAVQTVLAETLSGHSPPELLPENRQSLRILSFQHVEASKMVL
ncbi:unnamed protein product, partial [Thlaspi arvense]